MEAKTQNMETIPTPADTHETSEYDASKRVSTASNDSFPHPKNTPNLMSNLRRKLFSLWLYNPIQTLAASIKLSVSLLLLDLGQSVGLLGRVIS
jgi:hypothetical protein